MSSDIKKNFYTNTLNTGLGFISLGTFGVISLYFFDFPILFSFMKSMLFVGILVLLLNFISKELSVDVQDKIWVLIFVFALLFSINSNFNIKPEVLENKLYEFDNDLNSDIQIIGNKKVRKIIAKYNLEDLTKESKEEKNEVASGDKSLNDIKNEVLTVYHNSTATNENKLNLYIDNIDIVNVDYLINEIYLEQTKNNNIDTDFDFNNLKNAKFIRNSFYYEQDGMVITGKLDVGNGITIKIRPKNYFLKRLGV